MTLLVAILALGALVWVLAPLRRPEPDVAGAQTLYDEADARKRAALAAIVDLEDDRSVGKLAEDDFRSLKGQYEAEAVAAIAELDALDASTAAPDELEEEIARMREAMRCPSCGAVRAPNESCPRCGAS
jgi:cytochrome c-type biogenesis protein CcmH/NrfF